MTIIKAKILKFLLIGVILVAFLNSCYSPMQPSGDVWNFNFSSIYNPAETDIKADIMVVHNTDTSSSLFFKLKKNEFVSSYDEKTNREYIQVLVKYVLRDYETTHLCDSGTMLYKLESNLDSDFIYSMNIKTKEKEKYNLVVLVSDNYRKKSRRVMLEVDRTEKNSAQYFLIQKVDDKNEILFTSYITDTSASYQIQNFYPSDSMLNISFYKPIKTMPQSIFASTVIPQIPKPDTVFQHKLNNSLKFEKQGIYFISFPQSPESGVCVVNHGNNYPNITSPKTMIEPLKYLTSNKRYNDMINASDKKLAVDKFWLNLTSDLKRSKELIRIYYNRVQMANEMFGTYKQGWQTDRGMIYVVFGAPATVYKGPDVEQWIYGDRPEISNINFVFQKNNNKFTNKDYILQRENKYQTIWAQATETWLKGKAFSVN
ncbi:MAG: GWxTD domain-containing protein [Bacteroidales bacterium]|nr:GWxTD domain-containing protein [Bacteroidales bacterium]